MPEKLLAVVQRFVGSKHFLGQSLRSLFIELYHLQIINSIILLLWLEFLALYWKLLLELKSKTKQNKLVLFLIFFFFFFGDGVFLLCHSNCSGTHYIDQTGLKFTEIHLFYFPSIGIVPDFKKKYICFSSFSIMLPADLSYTDFTMLRYVSSLSSLFILLRKGWPF